MRVLGIADNHDAAAAVVVDGVLVAAASEERFDRHKGSGRFPWSAIRASLARAGLRWEELDLVTFGTTFTPPWVIRRFPGVRNHDEVGYGQLTYLLNAYIVYQSVLTRTGAVVLERWANERLLTRMLAREGYAGPLAVYDHHTSHAASAWRTQPRERCLVFTADAMGDGLTATVSVGGPEGLTRVASQSGFAALNTFYSRITEWLGFIPLRHEGKVTGLAAYAEPPEALLDHLRGQLRFVRGRFVRHNYLARQHRDDAFYGALSRWTREEIAAATQRVLEEAVTGWVAHHVRATGVADVAVAGGLFGNVKLNQRIAELPEVNSLWVFPNMGDGGLAVGAALLGADRAPRRLDHVWLGSEWGEDALRAAIGDRPFTRPADLADEVAGLLAAGRVVARFDGASEFGPRALGNRSILASAADPEVQARLNAALRRSDFMPFAPVVRVEDAPGLFVGFDVAADAARFMTVCFGCTPRMREAAPAAVHVDGTARPQVVHRDQSPGLWAILDRHLARTGLPALLNTSFNMHEEPIVDTPDEAVRAWEQAGLDALVLGPFLLRRPGLG